MYVLASLKDQFTFKVSISAIGFKINCIETWELFEINKFCVCTRECECNVLYYIKEYFKIKTCVLKNILSDGCHV